jgi:hypothetical protein
MAYPEILKPTADPEMFTIPHEEETMYGGTGLQLFNMADTCCTCGGGKHTTVHSVTGPICSNVNWPLSLFMHSLPCINL